MKIIILYLILFLALNSRAFAQVPNTSGVNQRLQRELLKMQQEDQKYRNQISIVEEMTLPPEEMEKRVSALWEKQHKADKKNVKKLEEIIEKHGWPGRSIAGKEGSFTAFLVIQHADLDYQKKYFPLLKEAVSKGEAARDDAAFLEDRILWREGKKQIYGTQLHFNELTQMVELWPIEDEEGVDARRASVGLEPIAQYVKRFGLEYKPTKER